MKSKKFSKKLAINKYTVADLNNREMRHAQGGLDTVPPYCDTNYTNCIVTVCNSKCPECGPFPPTTTLPYTCVDYTVCNCN